MRPWLAEGGKRVAPGMAEQALPQAADMAAVYERICLNPATAPEAVGGVGMEIRMAHQMLHAP